MQRKDIYEHLAEIYLNSSPRRHKKKPLKVTKIFPVVFVSGIFFFSALIVFSAINFRKNKSLKSTTTLILQPNIIKLKFNFDPAKKEVYAMALNKLDLMKFTTLGFSTKKESLKDSLSLRVEFTNAFKEKSALYIKDISNKWQELKIKLSEFKQISDWSDMTQLSFIIEEWNAGEKAGVVYLDNIALLY